MSITGIILAIAAIALLLFIIWALCRVSDLCDNEESETHDP
jgi:uncharacterized protein YoxC